MTLENLDLDPFFLHEFPDPNRIKRLQTPQEIVKQFEGLLPFGGAGIFRDRVNVSRNFHQIGDQLGQVLGKNLALIDFLKSPVEIVAEFVQKFDGVGEIPLVLLDQILDLSGKVEALGDELVDPGRVHSRNRVSGQELGESMVPGVISM